MLSLGWVSGGRWGNYIAHLLSKPEVPLSLLLVSLYSGNRMAYVNEDTVSIKSYFMCVAIIMLSAFIILYIRGGILNSTTHGMDRSFLPFIGAASQVPSKICSGKLGDPLGQTATAAVGKS